MPDEYDGASIEITLNRTLRVPPDGTVYNFPALFGAFPLLNVDLMWDKLPAEMARKSGLLIPMFPEGGVLTRLPGARLPSPP